MLKGFFFIAVVAMCTNACAQPESSIGKARKMLSSGVTLSQVLMDPQFDSIRTDTEFRDLVKSFANHDPLTYVSVNEPGTKITIKGTLVDNKKKPLADQLVYVYQTDTRGWYGSDRGHFQMNEGDRGHARLFGYVKTDAAGKFELHTIQPHGYPQSDLPAHIHIEISDAEGKATLVSELLFDDDERLQGTVRARSQQEKFYIARPVIAGKEKIYRYTISVGKN